MAPVSLKLGIGSADGTGPSFRQRFHAWWEGYELPPDETARRKSNDADGEPAGAVKPATEWTEPRKQLVQMLWGDGFSLPGEPEYVLELVKPFGLTKENTMLEIGAGLGGGTRTIASKIGSYIDGFDLNPDIAKRAAELAVMKGLEKKANVKPYTVETLDLRPKYYDACLIRETLLAVEDKGALFEKVCESLKPDAALVVADFFIDGDEPGSVAAAALELESLSPRPCAVEQLAETIKALGFDMRINKDETDSYADEVRNGWAKVASRLSGKAVSDKISEALMRETELWKRRNAAFEAGELQMRRLVCFKTS